MRFTFTGLALLGTLAAHAQTGVGIGTTSPQAPLHVAEGSVLFSATGDAPATGTATPVSGEGRRLLWLPDRAAFRVGFVTGTRWDNSNLGIYSFAAGYNANASGNTAVALGSESTASGERSFTFNGTASGYAAIAIGSGAQATNDDALAFGPSSIAMGLASICIGPSIARGMFGTAIGLQNSASGQFSTAIGKNARTNMKKGAMVLGDASAQFSSDSVYASADNQMAMRFAGGYKLYTAMNLSTGVQVAAGGGSWTNISDRRKKENFRPVDAEQVLRKVAALPLSEWNYKTQPASQRHLGPMAQDFYQAFRLDGIGADTTINSLDIDGVNMAAIQALEKRTARLQQENAELKAQLRRKDEQLAAQLQLLNQRLAALEQPKAPEPSRRKPHLATQSVAAN
ncbi:tail fiber domain-containing protein [Hymenobacter sp. 15J16-1T3B]|uniref:tail fiber domain-containing protein n=1 Tax=Hymenobacter sp. 15J16-1T3B TaxID=2886941 RepID=UPI001D101F07|nr:tail fiber domain-containing protein [Hymenobacter sp. 15J16-1T3B]MCC3160835.1 tail fiber domain-containing protein [Hymenobacter sp. 15J16-1T3B]